MRRFLISDPNDFGKPVYSVVDEKKILSMYFIYWAEEMTKRGKSEEISYENCLDEWINVNWARELL
jgi:hypothetical protein